MSDPPRPRRSHGPPDLGVSFAGIQLKNPIIAASGTFGYGIEFEDIVSLHKLGAFVVKGLSREPMPGNPPPRLFETSAGMLNSIGLQNIGARAFVDEKLPLLNREKNIVVIANVFGYTREDYEAVIRILNEGEGIAAYELNVSCPNTKRGGMVIGSDPVLLAEVVAAAKVACATAADREAVAQRDQHPADGARRRRAPAPTPSRWSTPSSPWPSTPKRAARASPTSSADSAARPSSRSRCAWSTRRRTPSRSRSSAWAASPPPWTSSEFMLAGAAAVEVGTASFWDPCATEKIVDALEGWCLEHRVQKITDLIGGLKTD